MSVKEKSARPKSLLILRFICLFSLTLITSTRLPIPAQQNANTSLLRQESTGSRASSDKGAVKVPFDLYGNNILVQIRVNEAPPLWFVFDSGASVNVMNERAAKKLGLIGKGSGTLDANGGTVAGSFVEKTTLDLAGVKADKQAIAIVALDALSEYSGRDVQGIVGNNFIQNFVVEIDYANHILIFHQPQSYNLANEPEAIELENRGGNPFIKVELSLDGKEILTDSFEIDTGSNGIFNIYRPFAERHKLLQKIPAAQMAEGAGGAGVGGETKYINARITSVKFGPFTISNPVLSISQGADSSGANFETGFIGTDLLRRFTVTLDYQSHRMLLKPNANYKEPFEVDMSGLELITQANNFKVIKLKHVRANFPAAKAGLLDGDILIAIGNRPAAEYGLDQLSKMFRQAGKEYRLTVKRGDKVIEARLKMKRMI